MSLPPAEFFWKIFSKEGFKLFSEYSFGKKKALVYPQLKEKEKTNKKNSVVVPKKLQYLCAVRPGLTVMGKVFSQASGICLLLTPRKSTFPLPSCEPLKKAAVWVYYI